MTTPKKFVFDLDGTLCSLTDGEYEKASPLMDRIAIVNELYEQGHQITIYTARGMGRFSNDSSSAIQEFESLTRTQLETWGVRYHSLFLGKPAGDFYVDDKAQRDTDFFENK